MVRDAASRLLTMRVLNLLLERPHPDPPRKRLRLQLAGEWTIIVSSKKFNYEKNVARKQTR